MRYWLTAVIAFALGVIAHFSYVAINQTRAAKIERHWAAVERYEDYVNDPANFESFGNGFAGFSDPPDPVPDLMALSSLGELESVDLVLPNAPNSRETRRFWMKFVDEHDDIIYSTGNPSYTAFTPSGDQPLHLQFWYLPTAEKKIRTLIRQLESMQPRFGEPSDAPESR